MRCYAYECDYNEEGYCLITPVIGKDRECEDYYSRNMFNEDGSLKREADGNG